MMTTTSSIEVDAVRPRVPEPARSGQLLQCMRSEFTEMPGLMLTLPQAARLWCVTARQAQDALTELVAGGFLVRDPRGAFRRRGGCPRCS
jgi:Fic family protein